MTLTQTMQFNFKCPLRHETKENTLILNQKSAGYSNNYLKVIQGSFQQWFLNIRYIIEWIATNFCTDIHGPQRMNPNGL